MTRKFYVLPPGYKPLPSGYYKVVLTKISERNTRFGDRLVLHYEVHDVLKLLDDSYRGARKELVGRAVEDIVSSSIRSNSRFAKIIRILTSRKVETGEEIDANDLINKSCYVHIAKAEHINQVTEYFDEEGFKDVSK